MSSMKRSRSILVELIIVILFLSIAACTLAQLFAAVNSMRVESRRTQVSLVLARDALERFSAGETLPKAWSEAVDGQEYTLTASILNDGSGQNLQHCAVTVCSGGQAYIHLDTARYVKGGIVNDE